MYKGIAHGGPLHGQELESRYPKGILVIDKPNMKCWIYDYVVTYFAVREESGMALDYERRMKAANEFNYDVRALDV